jgi:hypothetical protein
LNQYSLGGGATQIDLVSTGVGNIAAHEAGHFFANFHTHQFNASPNIMDQGGNLAGTVGVGGDLTFGTFDDVDVDFGDDTFVPNEGFTGTEDTLNAVAFGLSTGAGLDCPPAPIGLCRAAFKASIQLRDKTPDTQDLLNFGWQLGATTTFGELGTPLSTTDYQICVYDAGGLVRRATAPAGGSCKSKPCWKQTPSSSPTTYVYKDPLLTPDGTNAVTLKSGTSPKPKVQWKAKGIPMDDGALGLVPPVVVEVSNGDNAVCFGQTFTVGDITLNTTEQFKAKIP